MIYKQCIEFMNDYNNGKISVKSGSLRFYGDWFGRPMDNYHTVININYEKRMLEFMFDNNEILQIYNPRDIETDKGIFTIRRAERIIWKWYTYGKSCDEDNLRYIKYEVTESGVKKIQGIRDSEVKIQMMLSRGHYALQIC